MALTKIGSIGINTGIKFAGVTTITTLNSATDTLTIGGPVSIAGTLTYEDVTNIDSVGLITARDGVVVGSGITLSVDGDIFATGVVTATSFVGSGAELTGVASTENIRTNTNAAFLQNVSIVGTSTVTGNIVPSSDSATDIGTNSVRFQNAYVDTYYGDGSNLTGISADVVDDTSPQLGGNLDVNGKNIIFGDSSDGDGDDVLKFGAGTDLKIWHSGTNSYIRDSGTGGLRINSDAFYVNNAAENENMIRAFEDGAVELYNDNTKRFETTSYGTHVTGYQTSSSYVGFHVKGTLSDNGFGTNHGSGITNFDVDYYSPIPMFSSKTIDYGSSYLSFPSYASGNYVKFTAPVAGLYQLELIASVETHHGGDWFAFGWEINTTTIDSSSELANNGRGTLSVYDRTSVDAGAGSHFSTTIYMEANDYAILYQQSASAVRFASNQYFVRGHLIH
tara:strand:+ start:1695 stop:3041 length:1347 start_codon:yes stop_codon:yes gene_type:complete